MPLDEYVLGDVIGKGSYGEVTLAKHSKDKKQYVIKKIELHNASEKERNFAQQEVEILSKLRHPNIVSYKESFQTRDGCLSIVMGFCEGGDLYTRLKKQAKTKEYLTETQVVEWFVQISMALQYMHDRHILHRDLKTQNIFLTKSKIIKLGDLGIARVLDSSASMATTMIGTPYYMSPELFSNKPYNHKSDVWALGCCVYEMATLKHAFNAKDMNALVYKILKGKVPEMPQNYSPELQDIIQLMLSYDPNKRPSASRILRHPFIKKHIAIFLEGTKKRRKSRDEKPKKSNFTPRVSDDSGFSEASVENSEGIATASKVDVNIDEEKRVDKIENLLPAKNDKDSVEHEIKSRQGTPRKSKTRDSPRNSKSRDSPRSVIPLDNSPRCSKTKDDSPRSSKSQSKNSEPSDPEVPLERKHSRQQNRHNPPVEPVERKHSRQQNRHSPPVENSSENIQLDSEDVNNNEKPSSNPSRPSHVRKVLQQRVQARLKKQHEREEQSRDEDIQKHHNDRIDDRSNVVKSRRPLPQLPNDKTEVTQTKGRRLPPPRFKNDLEEPNGEEDVKKQEKTPQSSAGVPNMAARRKRRQRQQERESQMSPPSLQKRSSDVSLPSFNSSSYQPRSQEEIIREQRERRSFKGDQHDGAEKHDSVDGPLINQEYLDEKPRQQQKQKSIERPWSGKSQASEDGSDTEANDKKNDVSSLINNLQATLKMDDNILSKDGKSQEETNELNDGDDLPPDATGRLIMRIKRLRDECIEGLGEINLRKAYHIIDTVSEENVETALIELIGKDKFDAFSGPIWQLKFCEEFRL